MSAPTQEVVAWGYVSRTTNRLLTMHPAYFGKPGAQDGYDLVPLAFADTNGGAVEALRDALIQADLKIRSIQGADQSDVQFIRDALDLAAPAPGEAAHG